MKVPTGPNMSHPTLWLVDSTAICRFDTATEAVTAYNGLTGPFVFKMGDEECTVDKEDISLMSEAEHNQL